MFTIEMLIEHNSWLANIINLMLVLPEEYIQSEKMALRGFLLLNEHFWKETN